jgi:hypothetical protein
VVKLGVEARELLDAPFPCCLTSLTRSGPPHSVVIWCTRDQDLVTVNGGERALWLENVRLDPRVSLVVLDTGDILRYVEIRGRVVAICADVGLTHMTRQAQLYDGTEHYAWESASEARRYVVTIEPAQVRLYAPIPPAAVLAARKTRAPSHKT